MLSRAERTTVITANGCTNESVGPGSYTILESPRHQLGPSAAFAWTAKRSSLPSSAAADDNEYSAVQDQTPVPTRPWTSNTISSSFAGSTQRFALDKEAVAKPGPGAYQTSPKWVKQSPSWHTASCKQSPNHTPSAALAAACAVRVPAGNTPAAGTAAAAAGSSTHACEVLMSTPPSIPARHQSFGYETGADGRLIMQPAPPESPAQTAAASPAGKNVASSNRSAQSKPPARPSTSQLSKKLSAAVAGSGKFSTGSSSSPDRGPAWQAHHQQQQQQQAVQAAAARQQHGSVSPRFRNAAGGKLVLSKTFERVGSAAFASKSARLHQQEPDPDKLTPGPGTYSNTTTTSSRPASAPVRAATAGPSTAASSCRPSSLLSPRFHLQQQRQQLFARSTGRSAVLSVGPGWSLPPSRSVAPGPGTYDLSSVPTVDKAANVARVYGRTVQSCRPAAPKASSGAGEGSSSGFGCTSKRFGDDMTVSPGPGKYTADQLLSMSADAARRAAAASKRGAFGTAASSRPHSLIDDCLGISGGSSSGAAPGPGCYDVRWGLADRAAAAAARPSAGFVSASERFTAAAAPIAAPDYSSFDGNTLRGDQARLGPGSYLKLDDWRRGADSAAGGRGGWHSGYHQAPFGSESGRRGVAATGTGAAADAAPGPGAYAAVDVSKVFQPLTMPGKAGFCTTSQRFKLKAATPESVGPGTYAQHSSLVRPTFNVTLDQP